MDRISEEYRKCLLNKIKERKPLIHCITNVITVNDCANAILAVGGAPTMAHHPLEVEEITSHSDALVCNMGATECMDSLFIACKAAKDNNVPIVLDPVGVAASTYRRKKCVELISNYTPSCIRGNEREIAALYYNISTARGVDATENDDSIWMDKENIAKSLALKYNTIVVTSGKTDIVTDGEKVFYVTGGSEMMTRITGAGCMLSSIIGVYISSEQTVEAVVNACKYVAESAENAEIETDSLDAGTMTFRNKLIDNMYLLSEKNF